MRDQEIVHGCITNYDFVKKQGFVLADDGREVYFSHHGRGQPRKTSRIFNNRFEECLYLVLITHTLGVPAVGDRLCMALVSTDKGWRAEIWCFENIWFDLLAALRYTNYRVVFYLEDRQPDNTWLVDMQQVLATGTLQVIEALYPREAGEDRLVASETSTTRTRFEFERSHGTPAFWMPIQGDPRQIVHQAILGT